MKNSKLKYFGIALVVLMLVMNLHHAILNYGLDVKTGSSIMAQDETDEPPTVCLEFSTLEVDKSGTKGKACYKDAVGEDILEGYENTCTTVYTGRECQPAACKTITGCYKK